MRKRLECRKPFNIHQFIMNAKLIAVELVAAAVFFVWLFRLFIREVGW